MSEPLRYVINEQGKRMSVLLDLDEYRWLKRQESADPDLLIGLNHAELQALAQGLLAPATQARLDDLLARHTDSQLSAEETAELDHLLEYVDQLTILKTRARYTLASQTGSTTTA